MVDHVNRSVPVARETRASIDSTLTVLRDTIAELVGFRACSSSSCSRSRPTSTRATATSPGCCAACRARSTRVADEVLKRSEATLVRDRRHEMRVEALETALAALRDELAALQRRGRDDA